MADALRDSGAEVVFAGGERAERELVPAAGYRLEAIAAEGISRSNPLKAARAIAKAAASLGTARRILATHRPHAVLGGGGYVAGPIGLVAVARRIPLVLTEADSHLGLTNRLLAPRARRVCLGFPIEGRDGERYLVTGRPVPPRVEDRDRARERFGISPGDTCVLVFGGSLGARSINRAAIEAFGGAGFRVLHVAGTRDFATLTAPSPRYVLRDYVTPFGDALIAADLVVARAGGSIFEIAQYGLPAVLIPYPHASADHQSANARWMERAGAAVVVADADLSGASLARIVVELLADRSRLHDMAQASAGLARPDAATAIAREVLTAAENT